MTIHFSTLRNLAIVLLLSAVCALGYVHFFGLGKFTFVERFYGVPYPVVVDGRPIEPEFQRLSALIDAHIETIFSPLDGKVPPIPHEDLRTLRESFADAVPKAAVRAQSMCQTAVQLCDALLGAIQERERASVSLADTRSKAYGVALSQDAKREEEDKRRFFEAGIARRWAESAKPHRAQVVGLYQRLRTQERDFTAGAEASDACPEIGKMIVLKHPTSVRLRYGTATLPAGLSLRVVGCTTFDWIVDYSGEHVTIPQA